MMIVSRGLSGKAAAVRRRGRDPDWALAGPLWL